MGLLEFMNEFYVIVKIVGVKMVEVYCSQYGCDFISVMLMNFYGFGDNYYLEFSYVVVVLIWWFYQVRIVNFKNVIVWGIGILWCEFLYVDDMVDVCVYLMKSYLGFELINVGIGKDIIIVEFVCIVVGIVGYEGEIMFDIFCLDGIF